MASPTDDDGFQVGVSRRCRELLKSRPSNRVKQRLILTLLIRLFAPRRWNWPVEFRVAVVEQTCVHRRERRRVPEPLVP